MKKLSSSPLIQLICIVFCTSFNSVVAQCNWHTQFFDDFEYSTSCPDVLPGAAYTSIPQNYAHHSGTKALYLNFVNCNGANGTCAGDTVYKRVISVCPNIPMRISCWFNSTFQAPLCNMHITVTDGNNNLINNYSSLIAPLNPQWIQYQSGTFTPTTTTVNLIMITNLAGGNGNDLSMDDILVEQCNSLNIGSDTTVCNSHVLILDAGTYSAYLWNTGAMLQNVIASTIVPGNSVKYYYLDVIDTNGCAYHDTIQINFTVCSSVTALGRESAVKIYPNPAIDRLSIDCKVLNENTFFILNDVSGREVAKIKIESSKQRLSLEGLSKGAYFYKIAFGMEILDEGKLMINGNKF